MAHQGRMLIVMAGLVPAIHVFGLLQAEDVDARHATGHGDVAIRSALR